MTFILSLCLLALTVYFWCIIVAVMMSWLIMFNIVNGRNKYVSKFYQFLNKITYPAFRVVQKVIPPIGGMDLSPIVIILGINLLQSVLRGLING